MKVAQSCLTLCNPMDFTVHGILQAGILEWVAYPLRFNLWVGNIPWSRKWQLAPVFLPGKSLGWRSLANYSPWGHKESDVTEQLTHTHFSNLFKELFPSYLDGRGVWGRIDTWGKKRLRQASWWEEQVQDHWWVELGLGPSVGCESPEVVVGSKF